MINGNVIIAFFVMQYFLFFIRLLKRKERVKIKSDNLRLDALRKIAYKNVVEQREFIRLKYGSKNKEHKFNFKLFMRDNLIAISLFLVPYLLLQKVFLVSPDFWLTLFCAMIISFVINKILGRYNLQKQEELQTLFR